MMHPKAKGLKKLIGKMNIIIAKGDGDSKEAGKDAMEGISDEEEGSPKEEAEESPAEAAAEGDDDGFKAYRKKTMQKSGKLKPGPGAKMAMPDFSSFKKKK